MMRADAAVYMWGSWLQYTHFPPRSHQWGGELQKGAGKSDGAWAVRVCPVLTLVAGGDCLGSWFSVQENCLAKWLDFWPSPCSPTLPVLSDVALAARFRGVRRTTVDPSRLDPEAAP